MDNILTSLTHGRNLSAWHIAKLSLIALFFVFVIIVALNFDSAGLRLLIDQHRDLALLMSLLVIFLACLSFIPTIPLTLFLTVLIGPLPAMLSTALGNTLAALVHYQIGKQIGDVLNFEARRARLPFKLGKLPVNSPLFLLLGRFAPGAPVGLSFVCGAYCVPNFLYLWTTLTYNLLGASITAFLGDQLIKF